MKLIINLIIVLISMIIMWSLFSMIDTIFTPTNSGYDINWWLLFIASL